MTTDEAVDRLLNGESFIQHHIDDEGGVLFDKYLSEFDDDFIRRVSESVNGSPSNWLIPAKYLDMDIEQHVLSQCNTSQEIERVKTELSLFRHYELFPLLKACVYLVDLAKTKDIIMGVGRGSSVCCYTLYLIGIHKIDSIRYDLPLTDFFKKIPQEI